MGNDGGSIPKRSEVVKQRKRKMTVRNEGTQKGECTLTKDPLRMPLVICRRGLVYNKESLMKTMIDKQVPREFRHIRKLSNLVNISRNSFDSEFG